MLEKPIYLRGKNELSTYPIVLVCRVLFLSLFPLCPFLLSCFPRQGLSPLLSHRHAAYCGKVNQISNQVDDSGQLTDILEADGGAVADARQALQAVVAALDRREQNKRRRVGKGGKKIAMYSVAGTQVKPDKRRRLCRYVKSRAHFLGTIDTARRTHPDVARKDQSSVTNRGWAAGFQWAVRWGFQRISAESGKTSNCARRPRHTSAVLVQESCAQSQETHKLSGDA